MIKINDTKEIILKESNINVIFYENDKYLGIIVNNKYWPDYSSEDLSKDINEYMKRERRFGKITEQITN